MRGYLYQGQQARASGSFFYSIPVNPGIVEQASDQMVVLHNESVAEICNSVLPARVRKLGPRRISWLEIHSHGTAGKIHLGSDGITASNVVAFGTALRSYLQPGGVIEVMACSVASGKVKMTPRRKMQMDVKMLAMGVTPGRPQRTKNSIERSAARAKYMKTLYETIYADSMLRQQHVGMMLCSQLASTSGCTVRAACWLQCEEDTVGFELKSKKEQSRSKKRYGIVPYSAGPVVSRPVDQGTANFEWKDNLFTEIGHWEGPVYDFLPGGGLHYLGDGLKRFLPYRVLHTGSSTFA